VPAVRRLKTADNVRAALARIFRQVEADQMEPTKARVLIYCASVMVGVINSADLEARLQALEDERELGEER